MTAHDQQDRRPVVVAGYDGSPVSRAAVGLARDRAGADGAVHVVHTFRVPDDMAGASYYTFAYQDSREAAEQVMASLDLDGVERHVVQGRPAEELCRIAAEQEADAIVIGTRGTGTLRSALLGSVAHDVLHLADRPVTIVPARMTAAAGDGRTVVVGYDGSPAARAAVEHAAGRVGPGGRLIVVQSYHVPSEYLGSPYYDQAMEDGLERVGRRFAELERDAEVLRGVDYELEQLAGEAGEVVCRIAQHRGAGEIVIGTRGVGRIAGLLGSVAHDVLHRADRPVTVIPKRMVREPAPAAPTPA